MNEFNLKPEKSKAERGPRAGNIRKRDIHATMERLRQKEAEERRVSLKTEKEPIIEKNKQSAENIQKVIAAVQEAIHDPLQVKELIKALLTGESEQFPDIDFASIVKIDLKRTEDFTKLLEDLQASLVKPFDLYNSIVKDSYYDNMKRESFVHLNTYTYDQIQELLKQVEDVNTRNNIEKSILLAFCEELVHFLQYFQKDMQSIDDDTYMAPIPFLSKRMQNHQSHTEDPNIDSDRRVEADITFYFIEQGWKPQDSYWLILHRRAYGDEEIQAKNS